MRIIGVGESNPLYRRLLFTIKNLDGSPALDEAGGQPEISINGGSFNPSWISTLTTVGYGVYYATLSTDALIAAGDTIVSRYKSERTLETSGDSVQVSNATLISTVGVLSHVAYATVSEADEFFGTRLHTQEWFASDYIDRNSALVQATQLIDQQNFAGTKMAEGQLLQFPRTEIGLYIPLQIKQACMLVAIRLIEGYDPDKDIDALAKTSVGYSQARASYDRSFVLEHTRAGIPSAEAWRLIKPFLVDPRIIHVTN